MADRPALVPAMRALEVAFEREGMPSGARTRIGAALGARASSDAAGVRWPGVVLAAAAVVLVVGLVGLGLRAPASTLTPRLAGWADSDTLSGFDVAGQHCRSSAHSTGTDLQGPCRLVAAQMVVQTEDHTRVRSVGGVLRVERGRATFDVEHVPAGEPPVRVLVSHGAIEVLGTRFTVVQSAGGGHVDLHEGSIRFVDADGSTALLRPGERHHWGRLEHSEQSDEPAAAVEVEILEDDDPRSVTVPDQDARDDTKPVPKGDPPTSKRSASRIIERVNTLRAEGRPREAAALLRNAVQQAWDARTGQVLSYELIDVLHRELGEHAAACRHLRTHQRRWPAGRYAESIARALRDCDVGTN